MHKKLLSIACLFGALSVLLGAFAAHKLKTIYEPAVLQTFETGVRYQIYHSLALLAAGIVYKEFPVKLLRWAGYAFIAGILFFSGSLYLISYMQHQNVSPGLLGILTPLGGACFISGWLMIAVAVWQKK